MRLGGARLRFLRYGNVNRQGAKSAEGSKIDIEDTAKMVFVPAWEVVVAGHALFDRAWPM